MFLIEKEWNGKIHRARFSFRAIRAKPVGPGFNFKRRDMTPNEKRTHTDS